MPPKKTQSVIAIDPGYDRVGIAIFSYKKKLVHSECFIPKTKDFSGRLVAIHTRLSTLIEEHRPDAVALETLFFSRNQKTAIKVAEARGVVILCAAEAGIPLSEYSPQAVKLAVTGSGNADKKSVIKMVDLILTLSPKKRVDDEYDAIALGLAHRGGA